MLVVLALAGLVTQCAQTYSEGTIFFIVGLLYLVEKLGAIVVLDGGVRIDGFNTITYRNISA